MKGLIIKDILNMKKQAKTMIIFIVFYGIMSITTKNATFSIFILIIIFSMMVISSFAYDDYAKWDKYALSMPIVRKKVVASKYLLMLIFCVIGAVLSILLSIVTSIILKSFDIIEILQITASAVGVSIIFTSLILPFIYKFGVEKARIMIFIIVGVPTLIGFLLANSGITPPSEGVVRGLIYASPIFVILIAMISYIISCKIYQKKEL